MNIYLWHRIEEASDNYHSEGGVVVFANSLERAIELAKIKGATITEKEKPDLIDETSHMLEDVFIFSDSGCC